MERPSSCPRIAPMFLPYSLRPAAWRGYWQTVLISLGSNLGDPALYLVWCATGLIRVIVLISLWRMVLRPDEVAGGMSAASILTYTLVAAIFAQQMDVRTELADHIWNGTLVTRYLQPIGIVGIYAAELLGHWTFAFVTFSAPLLLLAPMFGVSPLPASPTHGGLFIVSLVLGVTVGLAVDFIFGAVLVGLRENIFAINQLRNGTGVLLAGGLLPLQLYPWGIGEVFAWLPLAATASAPLRIYTGAGDPALLLASQLGWAVLLWPLAQWVWRMNHQRLTASGG